MLHKLLELLEKKRQENALVGELVLSILDTSGWEFKQHDRLVPGYTHRCLLCEGIVMERDPQWVSPDRKQRIHSDVMCWLRFR